MDRLLAILCILLPVIVDSYVPCPGGQVRCPDFMTCCELANREFGCCPFPSAICCADHVHCCPQDMRCDVLHQACLKNGFPVKFFWKVPVQPELIEQIEPKTTEEDQQVEEDTENYLKEMVKESKCPDNHVCPGDFTCCKMYSGQYGCCPFHDADCCLDGFHCCPRGSRCNSTTGSCDYVELYYSLNAYPLKANQLPELTRTMNNVRPTRGELADPGGKCPDGHPCPEKFTCCKTLDSSYGCCQYPEAICCTDFIHCCPKGTTCNTTLGTCDKQKSMQWSVLHSSVTHSLPGVTEVKSKLEVQSGGETNVLCPDESFWCPDGNTCCSLNFGGYGCCPIHDATCCPDGKSCCPNGYDCIGNQCQKRAVTHSNFLPFFAKLPATRRIEEQANQSLVKPTKDVKTVECPDRSTCPDENTCCQISRYSYGCCPLPQATCCGDMMHCCPHGYWCSDEGCERGLGTSANVPAYLDKVLISRRSPEEEEDDPQVFMP